MMDYIIHEKNINERRCPGREKILARFVVFPTF